MRENDDDTACPLLAPSPSSSPQPGTGSNGDKDKTGATNAVNNVLGTDIDHITVWVVIGLLLAVTMLMCWGCCMRGRDRCASCSSRQLGPRLRDPVSEGRDAARKERVRNRRRAELSANRKASLERRIQSMPPAQRVAMLAHIKANGASAASLDAQEVLERHARSSGSISKPRIKRRGSRRALPGDDLPDGVVAAVGGSSSKTASSSAESGAEETRAAAVVAKRGILRRGAKVAPLATISDDAAAEEDAAESKTTPEGAGSPAGRSGASVRIDDKPSIARVGSPLRRSRATASRDDDDDEAAGAEDDEDGKGDVVASMLATPSRARTRSQRRLVVKRSGGASAVVAAADAGSSDDDDDDGGTSYGDGYRIPTRHKSVKISEDRRRGLFTPKGVAVVQKSSKQMQLEERARRRLERAENREDRADAAEALEAAARALEAEAMAEAMALASQPGMGGMGGMPGMGNMGGNMGGSGIMMMSRHSSNQLMSPHGASHSPGRPPRGYRSARMDQAMRLEAAPASGRGGPPLARNGSSSSSTGAGTKPGQRPTSALSQASGVSSGTLKSDRWRAAEQRARMRRGGPGGGGLPGLSGSMSVGPGMMQMMGGGLMPMQMPAMDAVSAYGGHMPGAGPGSVVGGGGSVIGGASAVGGASVLGMGMPNNSWSPGMYSAMQAARAAMDVQKRLRSRQKARQRSARNLLQ